MEIKKAMIALIILTAQCMHVSTSFSGKQFQSKTLVKSAQAKSPRNQDLINVQDANGNTKLHLAVGSHNERTKLLREHANPNIRNKMGRTSLHNAAQLDDLQAVQDLLNAGARKDMWDNEFKIPYNFAQNEKMRKLLDSFGDATLQERPAADKVQSKDSDLQFSSTQEHNGSIYKPYQGRVEYIAKQPYSIADQINTMNTSIPAARISMVHFGNVDTDSLSQEAETVPSTKAQSFTSSNLVDRSTQTLNPEDSSDQIIEPTRADRRLLYPQAKLTKLVSTRFDRSNSDGW